MTSRVQIRIIIHNITSYYHIYDIYILSSYTQNSDKKSYSSHEMVRAIDAASDSPTVFHAVDTSCNRSSDAQISLHNLVPTTDSDASHIHCTLNCICKKNCSFYITMKDKLIPIPEILLSQSVGIIMLSKNLKRYKCISVMHFNHTIL